MNYEGRRRDDRARERHDAYWALDDKKRAEECAAEAKAPLIAASAISFR